MVEIEKAQISGIREVVESADLPGAAERLHVGGDTAGEVWGLLQLHCRDREAERNAEPSPLEGQVTCENSHACRKTSIFCCR